MRIDSVYHSWMEIPLFELKLFASIEHRHLVRNLSNLNILMPMSKTGRGDGCPHSLGALFYGRSSVRVLSR